MNSENILLVDGLTRHFGGIKALNDVSFTLPRNSIMAMIGPNGAGKSTFINVLVGIHPPNSGSAVFEGREIAHLPAHDKAGLGIGRTFQLEELFPTLTVLENALVGCHSHSGAGIFATGLGLPSARAEERRIRMEAMENLDLIGLAAKANSPVSKLPLGEKKLLGIARALGCKPKLLMLDEPAGGLAAHEVEKLRELIYRLRDSGVTVFLIEHNMPFVMGIAEKIVVLSEGTKIAEGVPEEIRANERVIKAYLGEDN